LPTRVINVGQDESAVFLWETEGKSGKYAALSYCWGDSRAILKTTRENLGSNKASIELSLLPQTVRDAVEITRRLNIPYLWVDALCIIQRDEEDWARESGNMCNCYSNAYLTISASRSSEASEGCFGMQNLWGGPPHEFNYMGESVYTRVAKKNTYFHQEPEHLSDTSTEPINSRAWTLQETLLSNRTVFYTSKELVWEC
ncbi:HET-domain-containing protein, partial [Mytilinidion resinicola]